MGVKEQRAECGSRWRVARETGAMFTTRELAVAVSCGVSADGCSPAVNWAAHTLDRRGSKDIKFLRRH